MTYTSIDKTLRHDLRALSAKDADYWSFRGNSTRENVHTFFQYPAMMVPQVQGELIGAVVRNLVATSRVYDPFAGSGTVLVEAMSRGLDFIGQDINPLAVLICQAKAGPFYVSALSTKAQCLLEAIARDRGKQIDIEFNNIDKWFTPRIAIELSIIRRAINAEPEKWCRRFFWVALAETVRLTSNSRTSTFKLHIRPEGEISDNHRPSAVTTFRNTVVRNLDSLSRHKSKLDQAGLLRRGRYVGTVTVQYGDSAANENSTADCDLLVTSPPYGDNVSTVPYGQNAFLPLQWIELTDIADDLGPECLASTHHIDSQSLGGSRKIGSRDIQVLSELSKTFEQTASRLRDHPPDRLGRVTAFYRDLNRCLGPILSRLRPNAYMIWTVGNRNVGGQPVPTDKILIDLLRDKGAVVVTRLERRILSKRMAHKNLQSATMTKESILVMRKGSK
jgi:hypothetical protein